MRQQKFFDLYTREGEELCVQPWQSYPRPQMRRNSFFNLNGEWDFAVCTNGEAPAEFDRKIRVPFPPQSLLSGVGENYPEDHFLFYQKKFACPEEFRGGRVLLHVGAADQIAKVWLNGIYLGAHTGGYEPFSFEVTHAIKDENTLVIRVEDHMSSHVLPYGKQSASRGGMWYTPVSGIWQTVWMERVPDRFIEALHIKTGENWAQISIDGDAKDGTVAVHTPDGEMKVPLVGGKARIALESPRMWSFQDPYLYDFTVCAGEDCVQSYFAIRTLDVRKVNGKWRLCLNGKPCFFHGVLDQGYWSDGLFTPADPSCYEKDILAMKALGFNTLRKHIKIEPEQFYYDCDRLGMIVFQDMVNNGDYNFLRDTALPTVGLKRRRDGRMHRCAEARDAFLKAMEDTVRRLENHPCICYWTIFNEGWGQFESAKAYEKMKRLDDTRFVGTVSGWFKGAPSDVESEHVYFKPFKPAKTDKPLVLSEFGGFSYTIEGHAFNPQNEYGYKHYKDGAQYAQGLKDLYMNQIVPAVSKGLCAAIYTQVSDVEDETNGLLTYDRKINKISPEDFMPIAKALHDEMEKDARQG